MLFAMAEVGIRMGVVVIIHHENGVVDIQMQMFAAQAQISYGAFQRAHDARCVGRTLHQ